MVTVETKKLKLTAIKLNPDNPRRIGNQDMDRLVKSLTDFPEMMQLREIVADETMTVLGGNMRLLALRKIGVKEATAKIVKGLTAEQKREFTIKDNGSWGTWDLDALANGWTDLPLIEWGITMPKDALIETEADAEPATDRAVELNEKWGVKKGDLWSIGNHLLLCGDSTKDKDVSRLFQGQTPAIMVTDPPYGVEYDASWRDGAGVCEMTDYSYFKDLTPRQQLNDLMHKYAQETGGNYGDSWREMDRRWKAEHGDALSWLRWKHNQDHQTTLTLPPYIEATGKLAESLRIGHEMTRGILA